MSPVVMDAQRSRQGEIDALQAEVEWWREATEIKKQQLKKARELARRRGRDLKEARADLEDARSELKRLRGIFGSPIGVKP